METIKKLINNHVKLFIVVLFSGYAFIASSQDCADNLTDAEKLFEQGFLEEVPEKLSSCMEDGFTKTQMENAYKLIINSYLYDDKNTDADKHMLQFLRIFPEYQVTTTDPQVFKHLYYTYNTEPLFSIGASFGVNRSSYRLIEKFTPGDATKESNFISSYGFGGGMIINKNIYESIDANLEVLYNQFNVKEEDFIEIATTLSEYKITRIEIPISFSYDFTFRSFNPYLKAGAGLGFILNTNETLSRDYEGSNKANIPATDNPITESMEKINYWCLIGGGIKRSIPKGIIFLDLRYNIGLSNLISEDAILNNLDTETKYWKSLNKFSINNLSISVGYRYLFYNPRKKEFQ